MRSMNRRSAMIGLAALSSAPAATAVAYPNPDAGLIAACTEWLVQEQRCNDAFHVVGELDKDARAKQPQGPAEWADHDAAEKAADDMSSANWDRLLEICEIPALTIAGLHAKMTILAKANALELEENISGCLLDDVARLAMTGL